LPLPRLKRCSKRKPSSFPTPRRASAGMISREPGATYGVPALPNFGSRDPASGEGRYVRRGSHWTALDPKRPLGSMASERYS
jgi:hypothetical protein